MAHYWEWALARFVRTLVFGSLGAATLFYAARDRDARRRLSESHKALLEIDRQSIEVRLQLLRAQIEPHFLFNSLASVKRLYETEPQAGGRLLRSMRDYLEAAVRNRAADAPLAEEVALARAYLRIFEVRMGDRLTVDFEIEPGLQDALVPSFMLGTLVENAVKHGLAPKGTGGTLRVSAWRREGLLEIGVSDDGVGFREHSGVGVGLANTRARLTSLFGAAGRVEIRANEGGGVTATLRLPHRLAPAAAE
jgi:LytS/YehU family sensor histidine kinase